MIGLDTNVLARYYVESTRDAQAPAQQRRARALLNSPDTFFVPITVVLEFEWLLRSFYDYDALSFQAVIRHLDGLENVVIERAEEALAAAQYAVDGLDFADALHLALSGAAQSFVTFDDKGFARRANKLKLSPAVMVV